MGRIPRMRALGAVLRADWESYLSLMALTMVGWSDEAPELVEWLVLMGIALPALALLPRLGATPIGLNRMDTASVSG